MKNIKTTQNKAITLIALVITMVVLIILATVVINLSLGDNGIFNRAREAKEQYSNASDYEISKTEQYTNDIDLMIANNRGDYVPKADYERLQAEVNALKAANNNRYLISQSRQLYSTAQRWDTWTNIATIPLSGHGSGYAILTYSASTGTQSCSDMQIEIYANNTIYCSDRSNTSSNQTYQRAECSTIVPYDENTTLYLKYCSNTGETAYTPFYSYSVLLLPNLTNN